jgi:hypothetical protein
MMLARERDRAGAEDGRRQARRGGCARELGVAGVEDVEAAEGDAQVVAEDDAVFGQHRRAAAGVARHGAERGVAGVEHRGRGPWAGE